jgi:hypothetical protein
VYEKPLFDEKDKEEEEMKKKKDLIRKLEYIFCAGEIKKTFYQIPKLTNKNKYI